MQHNWKLVYEAEYKVLKSIFATFKSAVKTRYIDVVLRKPEYVGENQPDWTTRAEIVVSHYIGGEDNEQRKVMIWFNKNFEVLRNVNSDKFDTDHESLETNDLPELIKFVKQFMH